MAPQREVRRHDRRQCAARRQDDRRHDRKDDGQCEVEEVTHRKSPNGLCRRDQLYRVPVLITGCTSLSAQSTVIRLETIAARRSSSSATTCLAERSLSAICTIETAPWTIFWRAAMIASAC